MANSKSSSFDALSFKGGSSWFIAGVLLKPRARTISQGKILGNQAASKARSRASARNTMDRGCTSKVPCLTTRRYPNA
jgi:hypothetical protein